MRRDRLDGQWQQQRVKAVHRWKKIGTDEPSAILDIYENFVRIFREKYCIAKTETKRQADVLKNIIEQLKNPIGS